MPKDIYQLVLDATGDRDKAEQVYAEAQLNKTMDKWTQTNS